MPLGASWSENSTTTAPSIVQQLFNTTGENSSSRVVGAVAALGGALRSCLGFLHESLMAKVDVRPPSFVRVPEVWNGMVLLSGSDRNAALADRVVANHAAFAARNGYGYWWHRGSLVASLGWQPYWHKIAMLRRAVLRFPKATAFVWIDDDIVLTNFAGEDMLQAALRRSNASLLATRDPANWIALNTGIMIVRNDETGREALEEVWRRATAPRDDGVSLAIDSQAHCLHEQQALQEMRDEEPRWRRSIAIVEQRTEEGREEHSAQQKSTFNLNTFLRWSHFNAERSSWLNFGHDAVGSSWVRGDFAGHCSGLSSVRRALCVAVLLGSVVA